MNSLFLWIVVFTALGGALSAAAAGAFLLLPESLRNRGLSALVSFAVGALLGAAFLDLLPEALMSRGPEKLESMGAVVLLGLLGFFLLEKLVLWRHCHVEECEVHGGAGVAADGAAPVWHTHDAERVRSAAAGKLILIGDAIHNLTDGVLIAAAFLTDIHLGIVTSIAVIAHEIPQEVGDFAILLHSGYGRGRAFVYNLLSSLTSIVGGVVAYFSLSMAHALVPYALAVAASSFIYIAVADLIPGLHKRFDLAGTVQQIVLIGLGIGLISMTEALLH
ncbi:MAG: ZIP family metal transporter [Sulfuricaulis sp.]